MAYVSWPPIGGMSPEGRASRMTSYATPPLPFAKRIGTVAAMIAATVWATGCGLAGAAPAAIAPPPPQLGAESVVFASNSGSRIHAWLVRGRAGAGAVLLLHGVGSNRTSMLARAKFLHRKGFTVLAPDFQAHGESPGEHPTFGALESLDAAAALAYLQTAAPQERVGVIGVSMGGAATLLGPGPIAANAFVLESVYPTIRQAVSDRLATWFGPLAWVGRQLTSTVISVVGSEVGVSEDELQPISRIGTIGGPLLMLAGTADPYTPLVEAESLYAHAPPNKSFWAVVGAGHEDLYDYSPSEYERRVGGFLEQWLRTGGSDPRTNSARP
jgi:uncharacterized protein